MSAELGLGPLPCKSEDDPARRNAPPRYEAAATGSSRQHGAIKSRPPEVHGWRAGVDLDFRSAAEVARDAAAEAALEQSRRDGTLDGCVLRMVGSPNLAFSIRCAAAAWFRHRRAFRAEPRGPWSPIPDCDSSAVQNHWIWRNIDREGNGPI